MISKCSLFSALTGIVDRENIFINMHILYVIMTFLQSKSSIDEKMIFGMIMM